MAIKKVTLLQPPEFAPGKLVKEFLDQATYFVKSDLVNYNDTSASTIFVAPANTVILDIFCQITTAFSGGIIPTLAVGVSGTVERHMATADIDVTTAGFYRATTATPPFEYTSLTNIIVTIVSGGSTAGKAYFWARYRAKSNRQYNRP